MDYKCANTSGRRINYDIQGGSGNSRQATTEATNKLQRRLTSLTKTMSLDFILKQ